MATGPLVIIVTFIEISELNANSVDPYQTLHSAASDQGLYCLQMSLLWDARLIWVKINQYLFKNYLNKTVLMRL